MKQQNQVLVFLLGKEKIVGKKPKFFLKNKKAKKNTLTGVFFSLFLFKKFLVFYQQFSPSPIGTQTLDFAASSASL